MNCEIDGMYEDLRAKQLVEQAAMALRHARERNEYLFPATRQSVARAHATDDLTPFEEEFLRQCRSLMAEQGRVA